MTRSLLALAAVAAAAVAARGHFVYVVPAADGKAAKVVFSDSLEPDENVELTKIAGLKLTVREAGGKDAAAAHTADKHHFDVPLPGAGPRVVFGSVVYGVTKRATGPAFLLAYHPKALVGTADAKLATLGDKVPAELVPAAGEGGVRFTLLGAGKPVADAEVTVVKPGGKSEKVKTGADGRTPVVAGSGRYAAWAKVTAATPGEHDGAKYDETRHYATLVVDVPGK